MVLNEKNTQHQQKVGTAAYSQFFVRLSYWYEWIDIDIDSDSDTGGLLRYSIVCLILSSYNIFSVSL